MYISMYWVLDIILIDLLYLFMAMSFVPSILLEDGVVVKVTSSSPMS